jgi:hypothetical protein
MYADDTSILNIGQDINELQIIISDNIGVVEQYFEINNLFTNPSKTHYILFHTKQCRQESNLKILIKNREISNVKSTNKKISVAVMSVSCTFSIYLIQLTSCSAFIPGNVTGTGSSSSSISETSLTFIFMS